MINKLKARMETVGMLLLVLMLASNYVFAGSEGSITEEKACELLIMQDRAVEANDMIYSSFAYSSNGMWIYPDDFAGTYIDNNILHVCLNTENENNVAHYKSLIDSNSPVVFDTVLYSRNSLQEAADYLIALVDREDISWYSYCVNVKTNGIKITTSEANVEKIREIANNCFPSINVEIKAGEAPQTTSVFLYGGDKLSFGGGFTLGMCGIFYGSDAIVTAGHACSVGNDIKLYGNTSAFARVQVSCYPTNSVSVTYGDYAVAGITDSNYYTTAMCRMNLSGGFQAIDGTSTCTGGYVYRFGCISGYGLGSVTDTDVTVTYGTNARTVKGLTEVATVQNGATYGDSGGPYTTLRNGERCYCGIHSGGILNNNNICTTMYYTPYSMIHNAVNFTAIVDN